MAEIKELESRVGKCSKSIEGLVEGLGKIILGKEDTIERLVAGILARGHILLEGLPGIDKTELVKGIATLCSIDFSRIQFTPDLLPGDITGNFILQETDKKREFVFQQGPIFANIILADEINRASPKTQSAMLEAMQERSVTVIGKTYSLPHPFFVLATQNPIDLEGTYPLPEAQLDRFLMKLHMTGPDGNVLKDIIIDRRHGEPPMLDPILTAEELTEAVKLADEIYISDAVASYISRIVRATHPDSENATEKVKRYVKFGGSPRAAISIASVVRSAALIKGRVNAGFEDVKLLAPDVLNHRIILDYTARIDGVSVFDIIGEIIETVTELGRPLPAGVRE